MEIILTDHTKERMALRKITKEMIETAIANPDRQGIGYQNRLLAFKSFESRIAKIVYIKKDNFYIIISVIWENIK